MKLTQAHLHFWVHKKAPAWVAKLTGSPPFRTGIHALINSQVPRESEAELTIHNTLMILRSARKRGQSELMGYLRHMATNPGCATYPEKRAALCRKILKRLGKELR